MAQAAVDPKKDQIDYNKYDYERSLRLSRQVGIAFTIISFGGLLSLLWRYFFQLAASPQFDLILGVALLVSMVCYTLGVWLTYVNQAALAAIFVLAGTLTTLFTFQIDWERLNGLDPVVVGLFASSVVIVAMGGVLGNYTIMFIATGICTTATALMCFWLPGHQSTSVGHAILAFILVVGVHWTAALFYVMASGTYLDTLRDLGEFRIANDRAKKLDELKDQFITNANHELRNPIMALYTYIYTVRMAGPELSDEQRTTMLDQALEVGDRVQALLESILDVNRIDQGVPEFTPTPINIGEAVANAAGLVDVRNSDETDRPLHIHVPAQLEILGDAVLLQEIFTNLLSNSIKYSAPNTPIEVTGHWVEEGQRDRSTRPVASAMVEVRVRDYGLGVPPSDAPLLFQRFVRLPRDLASPISGNGLGLYLCRLLTEAMLGKIWLESTGVEGEGTTIVLRLPAPPPIAKQG